MNDIPWNRVILAEFKRLACLTDDEILVLDDWVIGKSITSSSMRLYVSHRKINNIRASIREKYDAVQIHSDILPVRKPLL